MNTEQDRYFAQQALATLFSVTNKLQTQGDNYLQNLSVRQLMAMTAIIHLPNGNASIMNIARKLGATKQSTKQIISILEKKGYLAAVPNEHDRRAVNIVITPRGKQMIGACSESSNQFFSDIFREFTTKDLETLWTLLKKLYRFDGTEHDGFEENMNYLANPSEAKAKKAEAKLGKLEEKAEAKPGKENK